MACIVQLSDLHLLSGRVEQPQVLSALVTAIGEEVKRRGRKVDLLVVTGDIFDSADLEPKLATDAFCKLLQGVRAAMGGAIPAILVPGNHDRRRQGLFGPHRRELFDALRDRVDDKVYVHGCDGLLLSAVVPHALHKLPLWIIAYDSTFLPTGWLSAGGLLRQEDLLYAAAQIDTERGDWPVLMLVHHHLVPTPLTDLGTVDMHTSNRALRWAVGRVLPQLVAHADREELTMTALGAGTAISTLHTLGRAVIVLHGHKHYATARMLDGTFQGQGDVALVSAGSAGEAQRWNPTTKHAARIWPSFNWIDLDDDDAGLRVETISFPWRNGAADESTVRPLLAARRRGGRWDLRPLPADQAGTSEPRLSLNLSRVGLSATGSETWDMECERVVQLAPRAMREDYVETIEAISGATVVMDGQTSGDRVAPLDLPLVLDGTTRFRILGGAAQTTRLAHRSHGDLHTPFEWVSLLNRYPAECARLELGGLGPAAASAFGSAMDVGTGLETAQPLRRGDNGKLVLELRPCKARTLLRIVWPLRFDPAG